MLHTFYRVYTTKSTTIIVHARKKHIKTVSVGITTKKLSMK